MNLYFRLLMAGGVVLGLLGQAKADLPVACAGGACAAAGGPGSWVTMGAASLTRSDDNLDMDIIQSSDKAILNWQTFNIGKENTVTFTQPTEDSIALNRIWDPDSNPSRILGRLNAKGQVYLVNRNGIIFEPGSQINVQSLVATTLDMDDEVFKEGILSAISRGNGDPAFYSHDDRVNIVDHEGNEILFAMNADDEYLRDEAGRMLTMEQAGVLYPDLPLKAAPYPVEVLVQEGAVIESGLLGRVMLLAQNVTNSGLIESSNGQAILAAGNKIYLASTGGDPSLRGLLVEVDVDEVSDQDLTDFLAGNADALAAGNAINQGEINIGRGNVTMVGLAVNQAGRIHATTAVNANGSVRLLARDSITVSGSVDARNMSPHRAGSVIFDEGSLIEILPELDSPETAVDAQVVQDSFVEAEGLTIDMLPDSRIVAPSGKVTLSSVTDPGGINFGNDPIPANENARIELYDGSIIDVSGSDIELSMDRNLITVELRGNELKDSPLQRDGVLRGQKVVIDIRDVGEDGQIPIADVSGAIANIQRTIGERSTEAGEVSLVSEGTVLIDEGATIDVSGGSVSYREGVLNTTKVTSEGRVYELSEADPERIYDGLVGEITKQYSKWGISKTWAMFYGGSKGEFYPAYVDGKNAGKVVLAAPNILLSGDLLATTVAGLFQRDRDRHPRGGTLIVGLEGGQGLEIPDYRAPNVYFHLNNPLLDLDADQPLPYRLELSTEVFSENGFSDAIIHSNGLISIPADVPVELPAGGSLTLIGQSVEIDSNIRVPSGDVQVDVETIHPASRLLEEESHLTIAEGVTISTRGLWVNDSELVNEAGASLADSAALIDGGDISLSVKTQGILALGSGVQLDASGGAWLQENGDLIFGRGGDISISAEGLSSQTADLEIAGDLSLSSYSGTKGGNLTLAAPQMRIYGSSDPESLALQEAGWSMRLASFLNEDQRAVLVADTLSVLAGSAPDAEWESSYAELLIQVVSRVQAYDGDISSPEKREALISDIVAELHVPFAVPAMLFQQGGFSKYTIRSIDNDLIVEAGTELRPLAQNYELKPMYQAQPRGDSIDDIAELHLLRDHLRNPVDIELAVRMRQDVGELPLLDYREGAHILTDTGANVTLASAGRMNVFGSIDAPAGDIRLQLTNNSELFHEDKVLHIGSTGDLRARGVFVPQPNAVELDLGQVLDAGSVKVTAEGGYIQTDEGSNIDVSGATANLDLNSVSGSEMLASPGAAAPVPVASNAGTVSFQASEGMLLQGDMHAEAAKDLHAGDGLLSIVLDSRLRGKIDGDLKFPVEPRLINIIDTPSRAAETSAGAGPEQPEDMAVDLARPAYDGLARISLEQIENGGFDNLVLESREGIDFTTDNALAIDGSIVLDSPIISSQQANKISLQAQYVQLGPRQFDASLIKKATLAGHSSLRVEAGFIELAGDLVVQGFDELDLHSNGDIRLRGLFNGEIFTGSLSHAGVLNLTADQIYPTTLTQYLVQVGDVAFDSDQTQLGTIRISGGNEPSPVLSAGGQLVLEAANIVNGGVVKAPFGEIILRGINGSAGKIELQDGSLLSTSAEGQSIPFGNTLNGTIWNYQVGTTRLPVYNSGNYAVPQQRIELEGDTILVAENASVDMSADGELVTFEFIPGPGGSQDFLRNADPQELFAILPWLNQPVAPYDAELVQGDPLAPGASVQILSDVEGLQAGIYTILPAAYGLLPGAYLVSAIDGYQDIQPEQNVSYIDGTRIVAGRRSTAGTDITDSRTSGYLVRPGDYGKNLAEYREQRLSDFLIQQAKIDDIILPPLPIDGGQLILQAESDLVLNGKVNAAVVDERGKGGQLDILARDIAVVASRDADASGVVQLEAETLNALEVESILIGGLRTDAGSNVSIDTIADNIVIEEGISLAATDLMISAKNAVVVGKDVSLLGEGDANVNTEKELVLNGAGGFLQVSAFDVNGVRRDNVGLDASGDLIVEAGALLQAQGTITLDATGVTRSNAQLVLEAGNLNLGAADIVIGQEGAAGDSMVLSNELLAGLSRLENLNLRSANAIKVDDGIELKLNNLAVDAPGLVSNTNSTGATSITANGNIRFTNNSPVEEVSSDNFIGSLQLSGENIILGQGKYTLAGFNDVSLKATDQIRGSGSGELVVTGNAMQGEALNATGGNLTLTSKKLTVETAADTSVSAAGALLTKGTTEVGAATVDEAQAPLYLGGALSLSGASVQHGADIEVFSGRVSLLATGEGGDLSLLPDANIDVSGRTMNFTEKTVDSWGGEVILSSDSGNIAITELARIDLSGVIDSAGGGSDAGRLLVQAPGSVSGGGGTVTIAGDILALAVDTARSGSFTLDAGHLPQGEGINGFTDLNRLLNAGGFHERRDMRLRNGDIEVAGKGVDAVRARHVVLSADGEDGDGNILISGKIEASGPEAGTIALHAGGDIYLTAGSDLVVDASAAGEEGGTILLNSANENGSIQFDDGARLSAVGGDGAAGGTVHMRTMAIDKNNDGSIDGLNISALNGIINGAENYLLEAVTMKDLAPSTNIDAAILGQWQAELTALMGQSAAILGDLQGPLAGQMMLVPGLELRASGDVSLVDNWDFNSWRFDNGTEVTNVPGWLTLRAAGNVNINAPLSDGFAAGNLRNGESWSYTIVAGADIDSANPSALLKSINASGAGDLLLAAGKQIRTGTGDIALVAAGDMVLANQMSVIYTAGVPAVAAEGTKNWMSEGGNISLYAGHDIRGSLGNQLIADWYVRQGGQSGRGAKKETQWAVNIGNFRQNVASFGGGDVDVEAGHDIHNLSVLIPTTGKQIGDDPAAISSWGGGDLQIVAGGDINSGVFLLGKGEGLIQAGRSLASGVNIAGKPLYAMFASGDSDIDIRVVKDLYLDAWFDPMTMLQKPNGNMNFFSYTKNSSVRLTSLGGDINLHNSDMLDIRNYFKFPVSNFFETLARLYPGTLLLSALDGSININQSILLVPAEYGSLELLAGDDVNAGYANIVMSDLNPELLAGSQSVASDYSILTLLKTHALTPVHARDNRPVYIIARDGNINGGRYVLPKKTILHAGLDLVNIFLEVQNVQADDVSRMEADRDIRFTPDSIGLKVEVGGAGDLAVLAGRNIDLGTSGGITSIGNTKNPALPDGGAAVTVMAGIESRPDYAGFIDSYFVRNEAYRDRLVTYVSDLLGQENVVFEDALSRYQDLSLDQQRPLIIDAFFNELRESGRDATISGSNDFSRGEAAISTLFPVNSSDGGEVGYVGDLSMFLSRIYTIDGGDINILVPGGLVNGGSAVSPEELGISKSPSDLGVVAQRAGSVRTFTDGDFLVNQSRVFTLLGGDILMWSANGNIDAGRGAKSAISAPEPKISIKQDGSISIDFSDAVAGSGIRAIVTRDDVVPGDVDLFAPKGVVDAGEAGIGAAGNLTIGARQVIGADNIDIGGAAVGVPVADTGGLSAGMLGASGLSTGASKSAEENLAGSAAEDLSDSPMADSAMSFLEVEVLGYGESDKESLGASEDEEKKSQKE